MSGGILTPRKGLATTRSVTYVFLGMNHNSQIWSERKYLKLIDQDSGYTCEFTKFRKSLFTFTLLYEACILDFSWLKPFTYKLSSCCLMQSIVNRS